MNDNYPLIPRQDMDFLLGRWLKLEEHLKRPEYHGHDLDTLVSILDLAEKMAVDVFLPHNRKADTQEPYLKDGKVHVLPEIIKALDAYRDTGFFSAPFAEEYGGMGLPYLVHAACFAQFSAASIATAAYPMLTIANAGLITTFGSKEQVEYFAYPEIQGRWLGTMCLSEPQAGSSLADVRTKAEQDGEDELGPRYKLRGNKMWISGGDQNVSENIVHLVLAKIPDADGTLPEGTAGISLFIVPKLLPNGEINDIAVAGINHKLGYRGTANCLLNFGESEGASGWLIGEAGHGLAQMFHMMNEARIMVGLGAAVLAYRGYRHALQYAQERSQGREIGVRSGKPIPIIRHVDVRHMLLAQKTYAEGAFALCLYAAKLVDQHDDADAQELLSLLTPVVKTWPSEYGLAANDLAIQVHGGYGYTRDFDVEQIYRDNRLNPIHEGTTGIQAMDLLGRKILKSDGKGLAVLKQRMLATTQAATELPAVSTHAKTLETVWQEIDNTIANLKTVDSTSAFDNATLFLRAFGHGVLAWIWLDVAVVAGSGEQSDFSAGKLSACRYFYEVELPHALVWLNIVKSGMDVAASTLPEQL